MYIYIYINTYTHIYIYIHVCSIPLDVVLCYVYIELAPPRTWSAAQGSRGSSTRGARLDIVGLFREGV